MYDILNERKKVMFPPLMTLIQVCCLENGPPTSSIWYKITDLNLLKCSSHQKAIKSLMVFLILMTSLSLQEELGGAKTVLGNGKNWVGAKIKSKMYFAN